MTIFEQIKSAIDMRTVAEGYGLHINQAGMCLCPFHDERTPSAKIYHDSFHCFGCGTHTDVIGFAQRLFGIDKPIEAVKKLNQDFGLHIDVGKAPTHAEVLKFHKRGDERKEYEIWEQYAWKTLHDYLWLMKKWRLFVSHTSNDVCDDRFMYSLHHFDYAEYLCSEFISKDKQGRLSMKQTISATAVFLSRTTH